MIPPDTTTTQPQGEKGGMLANYLRSRQSLADLAGTAAQSYQEFMPNLLDALTSFAGIGGGTYGTPGQNSLPSSYQRGLEAEQAAIERATRTVTGGALSGLQRRGVLNSSVTGNVLTGIAGNASQQMARAAANYQQRDEDRRADALRMLSGILGGGANTASSIFLTQSQNAQAQRNFDAQRKAASMGALGGVLGSILGMFNIDL